MPEVLISTRIFTLAALTTVETFSRATPAVLAIVVSIDSMREALKSCTSPSATMSMITWWEIWSVAPGGRAGVGGGVAGTGGGADGGVEGGSFGCDAGGGDKGNGDIGGWQGG